MAVHLARQNGWEVEGRLVFLKRVRCRTVVRFFVSGRGCALLRKISCWCVCLIFWLREGLIVRCEVRNLLGRCANPCESLCLAPPHAAAVSQCRKFVLLLLHECRFCFFECDVAQVSGLLVSLPGRGSARTFGCGEEAMFLLGQLV